jgi:osmotically-inducible protein OsmY
MSSVQDETLKQTVTDELAWEPSIDASHIGVTAKNGVITLTGHVDTYWQKQAAEHAAGRVKGVKGIAEEIDVRLLSGDDKRNDDDIAAAAINRLMWDIALPRDAIKVKVEKGFITLTGSVDWHYQAVAAADDIRGLMGVTGVANQLSIKHAPNTKDIRKDIEKALHRAWYDFDNIAVVAEGGCVELSGDVDSWSDKQTAGAIAWAAAGTVSVKNNIHIS